MQGDRTAAALREPWRDGRGAAQGGRQSWQPNPQLAARASPLDLCFVGAACACAQVSKVQPIMVVYFEGQIHRIPVKNGPDGLTEFTTKIRWAAG